VTTVADLAGELWSIRSGDDPYPVYARLRDHGGLFQVEPGHWLATRHAPVRTVLASRLATVRPLDSPVQEETSGQLDLAFLDRNPPDHGRLRKLATPAFRPALMRSYRDQIAELVDGLLADVTPGEPFDLVRQLAMPVPVGVICTLMGIDGADIRRLERYGKVVGVALSGGQLTPAQVSELDAAKDELSAMFARLAEERAADPRDDVISHLVQAMPDRITPYELMVTTRLLLIAGFETTVNLIGNATHALLSDREAWQGLVDDPGSATQVVEEALRYDPPVQSTGRFVTEDLEVEGATIPAGAWVTTLIASANRDETVFTDPDRFDPGRGNADDHLAFSGGIHYCLGAPLARLEGEVALAGLAERFPGLELAGPGEARASTVIRGFARLPVVSR
jgi:cytochrome P450